MTEERTINEEMLEIVKALTEKVEALEKTIYAKDSLLMKAGYVVTDSPSPVVTTTIGGESSINNVSISFILAPIISVYKPSPIASTCFLEICLPSI